MVALPGCALAGKLLLPSGQQQDGTQAGTGDPFGWLWTAGEWALYAGGFGGAAGLLKKVHTLTKTMRETPSRAQSQVDRHDEELRRLETRLFRAEGELMHRGRDPPPAATEP